MDCRSTHRLRIDLDRHGKPKRMTIRSGEYFTAYEDDSKVSDTTQLTAIRESGIEQKLNSIALEESASWILD